MNEFHHFPGMRRRWWHYGRIIESELRGAMATHSQQQNEKEYFEEGSRRHNGFCGVQRSCFRYDVLIVIPSLPIKLAADSVRLTDLEFETRHARVPLHSLRRREMVGIRWFICYQHCYECKRFEHATHAMNECLWRRTEGTWSAVSIYW